MQRPKFSVIIPVYNRPQEVDELLASLVGQTVRDFEVIIVEDGSADRSDSVADRYRERLTLHYFFKPNAGPGPARNFGFEKASGQYLVVFDSDCILPPGYFEAVEHALRTDGWDAWGGPDRAHEKFTIVQRAMGYTMSSFFTTGGIRGGRKRVGWFQPRSFNMGIARKVFEETRGFRFDRYAEDIEFSIRMKKAGYKIGLIPEAFVYHKRRTSFRQFYDQVFNFGRGRALVGSVHPEAVKATHWFPTVFVMGTCLILLSAVLNVKVFLSLGLLWLAYFGLIFLDSCRVNKDLRVAALSMPAAFLQLWGYGSGFVKEWIKHTRVKRSAVNQ
ncbi:MAG TPA: glycosyltransferase [Ohtaekwangia sp.]|nr:glycosyltransferase [Ohtaekwangia sp.]